MDIGGEERPSIPGEFIQQEDGSCLGHGFRLSLCNLKLVSPRDLAEGSNFSEFSKEPTGANVSSSPADLSSPVQLTMWRGCPVLLVLMFPSPSLDHNPGTRGWVRRVPLPSLPVHNYNKPPTH